MEAHTGAGGMQAGLTTVSTDKEALPACRFKLCSLPQSCASQAGKQLKQMKVTRSLSVLPEGSVLNRSFRANRLCWMQTLYKIMLSYFSFGAACCQ